MTPLPLKTLIREKNARVWGHIFKMGPLPLKTLIREKNVRVLSVCSRQEQGNSCSYIAGHQ
jgi:hypothetical protein